MENVKFAFEDLKVYEKALDLVDLAYDTSANFPEKELYGLISPSNRTPELPGFSKLKKSK